jgi:hypothetical protein
LFVGSYPTVAD